MAKKGYTDKTAIEQYLLRSIDSSFNNQVNEWIEGVENTIDLITGRNFVADTAATARLYDGDGSDTLAIDDAIEVSTVEIGADNYGGTFRAMVATGANRFFTLPNNHTAVKEPITHIELNSDTFIHGRQNQKVTAKWGYSAAAPADIKRAATVFVAGIINQNSPSGDQVKSKRIGDYQVTYNTDKGGDAFTDFDTAIATLDAYKRFYL